MIIRLYRIIAPGMKGVALNDALREKPQTPVQAEALHGLPEIGGTGRMKPAGLR